MLRVDVTMLSLVFGHTAQEPPLRLGPMPSLKVRGAELLDHTGRALARHDGHRWTVQGRQFYRLDIAGPVLVKVEGGAVRGPFEHFSLVNGTAYASRDPFAHYSEPAASWHLHNSDAHAQVFLLTSG
jgi:hypothetical protein